ncbi:unnamed protein product [Amoebophrya sp. A120]|nr:unnamed protein product [Amoebophrya sp. A120]|eukprot:GSA120T00024873001.1
MAAALPPAGGKKASARTMGQISTEFHKRESEFTTLEGTRFCPWVGKIIIDDKKKKPEELTILARGDAKLAVEHLCSDGAFGKVVRLCMNPDSDRNRKVPAARKKNLAVKVISKWNEQDKVEQLRQMREAAINLQFENGKEGITPCFGVLFSVISNILMFIMPQAMMSWVKFDAKKHTQAFCAFTVHVLNGYRYYTSQGLQHRDIKPSNMLLRSVSDLSELPRHYVPVDQEFYGFVACICDWGSAKHLTEETGESGQHSPRGRVGTDNYASVDFRIHFDEEVELSSDGEKEEEDAEEEEVDPDLPEAGEQMEYNPVLLGDAPIPDDACAVCLEKGSDLFSFGLMFREMYLGINMESKYNEAHAYILHQQGIDLNNLKIRSQEEYKMFMYQFWHFHCSLLDPKGVPEEHKDYIYMDVLRKFGPGNKGLEPKLKKGIEAFLKESKAASAKKDGPDFHRLCVQLTKWDPAVRHSGLTDDFLRECRILSKQRFEEAASSGSELMFDLKAPLPVPESMAPRIQDNVNDLLGPLLEDADEDCDRVEAREDLKGKETEKRQLLEEIEEKVKEETSTKIAKNLHIMLYNERPLLDDAGNFTGEVKPRKAPGYVAEMQRKHAALAPEFWGTAYTSTGDVVETMTEEQRAAFKDKRPDPNFLNPNEIGENGRERSPRRNAGLNNNQLNLLADVDDIDDVDALAQNVDADTTVLITVNGNRKTIQDVLNDYEPKHGFPGNGKRARTAETKEHWDVIRLRVVPTPDGAGAADPTGNIERNRKNWTKHWLPNNPLLVNKFGGAQRKLQHARNSKVLYPRARPNEDVVMMEE